MEANRLYDWCLKPADREVVHCFVNEQLLPNSELIRKMHSVGQVPIVLYEPLPEMIKIFGTNPIVAMTKAQKKILRDPKRRVETDSRVFCTWLDRKLPLGMVKVFAVIHAGTLVTAFLFNWVSGHELYVEVGSLDEDQNIETVQRYPFTLIRS